jgi:hypothetical protein
MTELEVTETPLIFLLSRSSIRHALDLYDIWMWILSNNKYLAHVFENLGKVKKK